MAHYAPVTLEPESRWMLDLFRSSVETVPAYRKVMADNGVKPEEIRTVADFAALPPVTKENYLTAFDLNELMPNSDITLVGTWSTSSGSSGRPSFWGRGRLANRQSTRLHARILRKWGAAHRSTLLVNCFAQGDWIAGSYTFRAIAELAEYGLPLVGVVNPGIDVEAARRDIAMLGRYYEQVVIAGYPPSVRDILDGAGSEVLDQNLRLLLAGESITEDWRDGVLGMMRQSGRVDDVCLIYGTADFGMVGYETPSTIALRRRAHADSKLDAELFRGEAATATFVEIDSSMRYAEADSTGRLIFTVDNSMPLVRYRMNDEGSVFTVAEVAAMAAEHGHRTRIRVDGPDAKFVVLRGRRDVAMSFYAVKIYPEPIRFALSGPTFSSAATGRFVAVRTHDERLRPGLGLRVQLRAGARVPDGFVEVMRDRVDAAMVAASTEYRELRGLIGDVAAPQVTLHEFDSPHFRNAIKDIWQEEA